MLSLKNSLQTRAPARVVPVRVLPQIRRPVSARTAEVAADAETVVHTPWCEL